MNSNPTNHKSGLPRPPKVSKMRFQEVPEIIKMTKMYNKCNLMNTEIRTILLRSWDMRNHQIFRSNIITNCACNQHMILDTSNHRTSQNVTPNGPQLGTQNHQRTILEYSRVPLTVPLHRIITQIVPKWSPKTPKCSKCVQINNFEGKPS